VFEYDCPAGLAFDERWEVCVWPGSLPEGACRGSSEIAPVPRARYNCPRTEGYYADPENCRWFFACLDHARDGLTPLTAYEFRCPFGLVFDEQHLLCQWPWLVDGCGNSGFFAGSYFGAVAFGDATRRGYISADGGHVASGIPASPASGSTFVATGDLGLRSGVGLTSGAIPTVLQNGAGLDAGYGTAGILLTDANTGGNVGASSTYFAGGSRGNVKYSGSAAGGGEFGGQIAKSYLLAVKDTDSLSNAGSYNEGRHISSYASFPDSYVSGGRIENSGGYVLGEHFGIHRIGTGFGMRSGGSSDISGTLTAGINIGTGSGDAKISYSSNDDEGEYFSGSVPSSTPTQTVVKSPNIPVIPVNTLKKPTVAQIPIVQPIVTHQQTVVESPQAPVFSVTTLTRPAVAKVEPAAVPVGTYQQTVIETPLAPVLPVTNFRRPAVTKVESAAVPVGTYQQTVVETPLAPVLPVTNFRRPAVTKVESAAVPVGTYQQTVVETPLAPVIPVTNFRRPAVTKVEPAAVPVGTYQQTVVETPLAPVIPVTNFRRPAVTKVESAAVPVGTYQQTVVETPLAPVIPVTTFRRPAVAKVESAAVPVGTYQQTVVETPQAPDFTFTRPAVAKVESAAVPVETYQQTVVETPQAPVLPVTTFTRPAVAKVESTAVPVGTYQQTVVETPQAPVLPVTTFTGPAVAKVESTAVPVGTYQQTVVETPLAPVLPVTTFRRPAVAKVESAVVPVGTYQQTVVETPQAPVVPVTTFTGPAVAKIESAAVPVRTYQQTVVKTPVTAAVPIYAAVSPIQQAVSVTPHVRRPTVSQTSTVDTAPVTTYLAETPTAPAVLTRTRLQPVSYKAPNVPVAKPIVPVVNTYLSTPIPTVAPIPSDLAETGGPSLHTGDGNERHYFHGRPSISVATDGAAGISIPLLRSNVDSFGVVVNDNAAQVTPAPVIKNDIFLSTTPATSIFTSSLVPLFLTSSNSSSGHISSTTVPSIHIGSSIPIGPVVKSQTASRPYTYFGPAPAIFMETPPSVTPVPILQSRVSSGSYRVPAVPFVRYSYSSSAPTVVTNGAVSLNADPLLRPNDESYSFQSSGTITGDTIPITNTRVTPADGYSYPKPSTPFITGIAATFRGFPLDNGLGSAVLDRSTGLVSGLEIPSSAAGRRTTASEVISRKPYTNGDGASTFISTPTSDIETVNSHENADVPSSATVSPDTFIPMSHTANQKAILLSTVEPIHSESFFDGHFGARTHYEHSKSAASYPGAVGREKFILQNNVTYGAPLAMVHTAGSAFTYDADQARRQEKPYSGHVSSTPVPVTAAPGPSAIFISSSTRPVTYTPAVPPKSYATVSPTVKTTYISSALPVASVTSAPVLQSTLSEYKNLEEYGLRVGQFASRRKPTSTTPTSYDNENVEALLDKYSGKFGGLLDNNKEGFITEVITDDLAERGRSRASQGGIGDTLQRGHAKSVGLSDVNGRYAAIAGYKDEDSNIVFGTRTGSSTTPATSTVSSNLQYTADGTYISTTASTSRGGSRGKIRYGSNVDTDADGGIGYEAITVEREDTKSRSKEAPVVVITRLSDVNPLLVAKLGAQCICKSNIVTLKRPDGYSRGGNSGSKLLAISSPTLQDDITARSEIYKVPEHVPAAPLPGSNIVTGTSPDNILGLNDEISPSTFVNFEPVSFSIPKANKFLKANGLDETGFTPTPAVLVTTFRPHSKWSEVTHTTAKPVKIAAPGPSSTDARSSVGLDAVSTPLAPLLEVSPSIPTTVSVTSRSRAKEPLLASTTAIPIPVAGVPGLRRVASASGGHPKTGCPDSSVEVAGSARGLDVNTDGRAHGVAGEIARGAGRSFDRYGPGGWRGLDETLQGSVDCQRAGLFRHPKYCNKFYACHWDEWKGRYTLHVFNCPVHLAYDSSLGACNWPSKGPACTDNTLLV